MIESSVDFVSRTEDVLAASPSIVIPVYVDDQLVAVNKAKTTTNEVDIIATKRCLLTLAEAPERLVAGEPPEEIYRRALEVASQTAASDPSSSAPACAEFCPVYALEGYYMLLKNAVKSVDHSRKVAIKPETKSIVIGLDVKRPRSNDNPTPMSYMYNRFAKRSLAYDKGVPERYLSKDQLEWEARDWKCASEALGRLCHELAPSTPPSGAIQEAEETESTDHQLSLVFY
jgi:hypothetical protein